MSDYSSPSPRDMGLPKVETMGFRIGDGVSVQRSSGQVEGGWYVQDFVVRGDTTYARVAKPGPKTKRADFARGVFTLGDISKEIPVAQLKIINDQIREKQVADRLKANEEVRQWREDVMVRKPERVNLGEVEKELLAFISQELATVRTWALAKESLQRIVERINNENNGRDNDVRSVEKNIGNAFIISTESGEIKFNLRRSGSNYSFFPSGKNVIEGLKLLKEAESGSAK